MLHMIDFLPSLTKHPVYNPDNLHDVIGDVERKEERKTPEAMEK